MVKKKRTYTSQGKLPRGRWTKKHVYDGTIPLKSRRITAVVPEETHQRVYEAVRYVQTNLQPAYCASEFLIEAVEHYSAFLEGRGVLMAGWRPSRDGGAYKDKAFEHKLFYLPNFSGYTDGRSRKGEGPDGVQVPEDPR